MDTPIRLCRGSSRADGHPLPSHCLTCRRYTERRTERVMVPAVTWRYIQTSTGGIDVMVCEDRIPSAPIDRHDWFLPVLESEWSPVRGVADTPNPIVKATERDNDASRVVVVAVWSVVAIAIVSVLVSVAGCSAAHGAGSAEGGGVRAEAAK